MKRCSSPFVHRAILSAALAVGLSMDRRSQGQSVPTPPPPGSGPASAPTNAPGAAATAAPQSPAPQSPASQPTGSQPPASQQSAPLILLPRSEPSATSPASGPSDKISLNFRDTPLDTVLDFLCESAGLAVIKESPLDNRITVVSKAPVTADEAVGLLGAVLQATGNAATLEGKTLRIRPRDKAKKSDLPVFVGADPDQIEPTTNLITQVMPIKNIDAVKLRQDLAPLLPPDADVTASGSSNALVVTDTGANVRRVARLVKALDAREAASMDLRAFTLKFAKAERTATLLQTMFKGDGAGQMSQQQMMEMQMRGGQPQQPPQQSSQARLGGAVEQALRGRINAVADDRTNTVFVTAPADTLNLIEKVLKDLDANPTPTSQMRAFALKYAEAEPTAKLLTNLLKSGAGGNSGMMDDYPFYSRFSSRNQDSANKIPVNVMHDSRTNSVIVSAPTEVLEQVEALIKTLDANTSTSAELKVYQLKYAVAWTTADLLRDTFAPDKKDDENNRFGIIFLGMGEGSSSSKSAKPTFIADDRTNSVVVTASSELQKVIAGLIDQIDANPASEESMFIYRLRNAQSGRLEQVLNILFGNYDTQRGQQGDDPNNPDMGNRNRDQSGFNRTSSQDSSRNRNRRPTGDRGRQQNGQQLSPGLAKALTEMAGKVFVVADRDTNSLLVTTATKFQERVKQIIAELDKPVPQVLIKVLVAEVTHDDSIDAGIDFSILNRRTNGQGTSVSSAFGNASQTTGLVVSLLEDKLNAQLHALRTQGKLDVLSRPYILASDNQLASITVGSEVPFITDSRITETGQQLNTIQYRDVGIILDVTPHVNPDGLVIMDVEPTISQLTGTVVPLLGSAVAPVIAKRSAESRVGVRTGQTIVIGGLMEDRKTSTVNKIPLLGDLPLVGPIFARTQVTKSKTELLIFLTPHVAQQPDLMQEATDATLKSLQVSPKAVEPGKFNRVLGQQQDGQMPFTQPSSPEPAIQPIRGDDQK